MSGKGALMQDNNALPKPAIFIFDIFGVLSDSFNNKWRKENLRERPDLQLVFDDLSRDIDLGRKSQIDFYRKAAEISGKSPEQIKSEMEGGFLVNERLFDLIKRLRKNYKSAILSNSEAVFVRQLFASSGFPLEQYFDFTFISSEIGLLKPAPEAFEYCLKKIKMKPEKCLFVDDSELNLSGASEAGMLTYHFMTQQLFEDWVTKRGF